MPGSISNIDHARKAAGLRAWARGSYPLEAAAELLIRAQSGRLLDGPWVEYDPDRDRYWFNTERIIEESYLSGGERRLLTIAASFAQPEQLISLNNDIPGLDRDALQLVLAAVAHANGSHEGSAFVLDETGKPIGVQRLASAYPWPAD